MPAPLLVLLLASALVRLITVPKIIDSLRIVIDVGYECIQVCDDLFMAFCTMPIEYTTYDAR